MNGMLISGQSMAHWAGSVLSLAGLRRANSDSERKFHLTCGAEVGGIISPDRRIAGSPDRRIAGSPDRRIAGSPDRRIAGSPDRPTCVFMQPPKPLSLSV